MVDAGLGRYVRCPATPTIGGVVDHRWDPADLELAAAVTAEIEARLAKLDLRSEFEAEGLTYSELVGGVIVTHNPPPHPAAPDL